MDQWLRPLIVLRVVVPGGEERAATGGGRLVLTSVELWSDEVRWNVGQLPKPENPIRAPEWTMEDDIGTQYEVAGQEAVWGSDVRDASRHGPRIPTAAHRDAAVPDGQESLSRAGSRPACRRAAGGQFGHLRAVAVPAVGVPLKSRPGRAAN